MHLEGSVLNFLKKKKEISEKRKIHSQSELIEIKELDQISRF